MKRTAFVVCVGIVCFWVTFFISAHLDAQQPDLTNRVNQLEVSLKQARVSIDNLTEEVTMLRGELARRPVWNEDRFRASVIEVLDGQKWMVNKYGMVERVR